MSLSIENFGKYFKKICLVKKRKRRRKMERKNDQFLFYQNFHLKLISSVYKMK